ncbi:alpha/beta hydrolase, partial [Escherichia coli]
MPLDKHIADFLAASSGAPQPASLGDLRAATEVDLLRLQGEDKLSDDMQDYVVIADDGYAIALRAYTPAASKADIAQPAILFAHGGGWCLGSLSLYDRPCQA